MQEQDITSTSSGSPEAGGASSGKALVTVLAALAAMLGALPYLLYVDLVRVEPLVGVVAAAVAAHAVRTIRLPPAETPSWGEWLLGGWSMVSFGVVTSVMGFLVHGVLFGAISTVRWLAPRVGWPTSPDAGHVAMVGSAAVAALFVLGTGHRAPELLERLYPSVAGTRSPFFALASRPKWALLACAMLALGVAGALTLMEPRGLGFTLGLAVALLYSSLPLTRLGERERHGGDAAIAVAVERLFTAAGYRLTRSPVTGSAEVDPLLAGVDYLAASGERAYAVDVKVLTAADRSVPWTTASELRTAARALQSALPSPEGATVAVTPLLVVVDGRIDDSLRDFAAEQGVALALIDGPALLSDLSRKREDEWRDLALTLLPIPPGAALERAAATAG